MSIYPNHRTPTPQAASGEVKKVLANIQANSEFHKVLADMQDAFAEFKDHHVTRVDKLETMMARSELHGGGFSVSPQSASQQEHEKGFFNFLRKGVDAGLRDLEVNAALSIGSDPDGGYGVPVELDGQIEKLETDSLAMRRLATIKQVTTSDYKKLVSVGGTVSGWVGETDGRPETATPTLKLIAPTIGELYANPAVTQTALDDIGFDAGAWLVEEISREFADQEGAAFITGNGVGKPKGILSYTMSALGDATRAWGELQYIPTGEAAIFKVPTATVSPADCLIDLVHAVKAKYRKGASWLMNSNTLAAIRKFKDAVDGEYVYRPGLEAGTPNTLFGYPVEEDENMPDIGANAYPIAFGNFKRAYLIVDRKGTRLLRDPFTNKPFVYFYATRRLGGAVVNFEALKFIKVAAA